MSHDASGPTDSSPREVIRTRPAHSPAPLFICGHAKMPKGKWPLSKLTLYRTASRMLIQRPVSAPVADGFHHGKVSLGGDIVGNGIVGSKRYAAVTFHSGKAVLYISADKFGRLATDYVGIYAAEVANAVAIAIDPYKAAR